MSKKTDIDQHIGKHNADTVACRIKKY